MFRGKDIFLDKKVVFKVKKSVFDKIWLLQGKIRPSNLVDFEFPDQIRHFGSNTEFFQGQFEIRPS